MKSVTFHKEWLELIEGKPLTIQAEVFKSVVKYAIDGVELTISEEASEIFLLIKPSIKKKYPREVSQSGASDRKKEFGKSLIPYCEKYGKEMIRAFFDYWSEMNKSKTKMRFELQSTWEVSRRLATWAKNNEKTIRTNTNSFSATQATEKGINREATDSSWINKLSIG